MEMSKDVASNDDELVEMPSNQLNKDELETLATKTINEINEKEKHVIKWNYHKQMIQYLPLPIQK
jgi:DNA-directed RNA polymerase specialized sigma subunit